MLNNINNFYERCKIIRRKSMSVTTIGSDIAEFIPESVDIKGSETRWDA